MSPRAACGGRGRGVVIAAIDGERLSARLVDAAVVAAAGERIVVAEAVGQRGNAAVCGVIAGGAVSGVSGGIPGAIRRQRGDGAACGGGSTAGIHQHVQQGAAIHRHAGFDLPAAGVDGAGDVKRQGFAAAFGGAVATQAVVALPALVIRRFVGEVGVLRRAAEKVEGVPLQALDFFVDACLGGDVARAHEAEIVGARHVCEVPVHQVGFAGKIAAVVGVVVHSPEHVVAVNAATVRVVVTFGAHRDSAIAVGSLHFARGEDVVIDLQVGGVPA